MTNDQWQMLVQQMAEAVRAVTETHFDLQFSDTPRIQSNCRGVVGGVKGFGDIIGTASCDRSTAVVKVCRFDKEDVRSVNVDVPQTEGFDGLALNSFEELAAFLLLHEVGHIVGREGDTPTEEAAANDYASSKLTAVLSHHSCSVG